MFPWWWIFVWAPRWPGSGDVSYGDWTNSLLTIREIEIFTKLLESDKQQALRIKYGLKHEEAITHPVLSKDERAVAENLLERLKTRR